MGAGGPGIETVADGVHLTGEQLACLACGEASAAERAAALAHLRACEACGDRLAAILLLRQMRPRRAWGSWKAWATPAAVAVLVMTYLFTPWPAAQLEQEPLSPGRQAVVDQFAAHARRDNIDKMIYDFLLGLVYRDVVPVAPNQPGPRTRAAVIDLRDGRYDDAVTELAALHREFPEFDSIAGWLGVALHLAGETDAVVETMLVRGQQSDIDPLQEMSSWYLGQHFLLTKQPERAVAELERLAEIPVIIGRMARAQLDELPLRDLAIEGDGEGSRRSGAERTSARKRTCTHHDAQRVAARRAA
jgi:hypothetical protein